LDWEEEHILVVVSHLEKEDAAEREVEGNLVRKYLVDYMHLNYTGHVFVEGNKVAKERLLAKKVN
jgi:hypothetical protein